MNGQNRSIRFYIELVVITVLSLVAAHMWIDMFGKARTTYLKPSLTTDLLLCVIFTVFAVYILYYSFSSSTRVCKNSDETPELGQIYRNAIE